MSSYVSGSDVSVIIPHFNNSEFAKAAILSVVRQTVSIGQIIVIDDGSDLIEFKELEPFCKSFLVDLIRIEQNSGTPAVPRNIGVLKAKNNWIAFLDADDLWHPNKIEQQLLVINDFSRQILVSTQSFDFSAESSSMFGNVREVAERQPLKKMVSYKDQLFKYQTPFSSILLPKSWLIEIPFSEEVRWRGREDVLNIWSIQRRYGDSVKILQPLVAYRRHRGQISKDKIVLFATQMRLLWRVVNADQIPLISVLLWTYFVFSNAILGVVREIRGKL